MKPSSRNWAWVIKSVENQGTKYSHNTDSHKKGIAYRVKYKNAIYGVKEKLEINLLSFSDDTLQIYYSDNIYDKM